MKQIILFLTAMLFCCCSSDSEVKAEVTANAAGRTLVVYYSYTGNCREIVNTLVSQIQADVLEIQPAEKGLRYDANNYALGTQLLNAIKSAPDAAASYPAIDPVATSLDGYNNIIIVTPLWWSQMAAIMQTYLFQNASQMAGKHVGMIVSSHSSGISGVMSDARRLLPDVTWMGDALWINAGNHSSRATLIENWLKTQEFVNEETTMDKMYITIDGVTHGVTLVDNAATRALVEKMEQVSVDVVLNNNGDFEIWGALGFSLPVSNQQITAQAGDVVLYNGSNICLFYDTNSWSYTRLGKIDGLSDSELRTFLKAGQNNVKVTLSLTMPTGIRNTESATTRGGNVYYTLNGMRQDNPSKGMYIKNGKKIIQ